MPNLTDSDRQALRLADDLQKAMQRWLSYRGVNEPCTVSPFVDAGGQPAVLVKMNAQVARAMIDGLGPPPA
jgi:peroxiredoxin